MPIQIKIGDDTQWIYPKSEWQTLETPSSKLPVTVDKNFYVYSKEVL